MNPSRRTVVAAGLGLIAASNLAVLGNVTYNRSGEPEALLNLTERELWLPQTHQRPRDNSALALQLRWRVWPGAAAVNADARWPLANRGPADWLDAPKMAALGFRRPAPRSVREAPVFERYVQQPPRSVFVVLELEGAAYQAACAQAARAAQAVALKNDKGHGAKEAQALLDEALQVHSRLFAVDAGLDLGVLRRQFADRTRYAIMHAQVRPAFDAQRGTVSGFLSGLNETVHVPLALRRAFEAPAESTGRRQRFQAQLAFGRQLEPWLVSVAHAQA